MKLPSCFSQQHQSPFFPKIQSYCDTKIWLITIIKPKRQSAFAFYVSSCQYCIKMVSIMSITMLFSCFSNTCLKHKLTSYLSGRNHIHCSSSLPKKWTIMMVVIINSNEVLANCSHFYCAVAEVATFSWNACLQTNVKYQLWYSSESKEEYARKWYIYNFAVSLKAIS